SPRPFLSPERHSPDVVRSVRLAGAEQMPGRRRQVWRRRYPGHRLPCTGRRASERNPQRAHKPGERRTSEDAGSEGGAAAPEASSGEARETAGGGSKGFTASGRHSGGKADRAAEVPGGKVQDGARGFGPGIESLRRLP